MGRRGVARRRLNVERERVADSEVGRALRVKASLAEHHAVTAAQRAAEAAPDTEEYDTARAEARRAVTEWRGPRLLSIWLTRTDDKLGAWQPELMATATPRDVQELLR